MFHGRKPHRSKAYLRWCHETYRGTKCCVCQERPFKMLHHMWEKGTGQRCSDLMVARVCDECHGYVQGKRRIAFERLGELETWADLLQDALVMLSAYTAQLETKKGIDCGEIF